jgi:hypothetical protein
MSSGSRRRLSGLYLRFTFRHRVQRQRQKEIHGAVPEMADSSDRSIATMRRNTRAA